MSQATNGLRQMERKEYRLAGRWPQDRYEVVKESLAGSSAYLTSFLFHHGANFYVFSYQKEGVTKHTFIDAGDSRYRKQILSMLVENNVNPANIERIIITHRHPDHCGLADLLARESKAKILAHASFRSFVEGVVTKEEQRWMSDFKLSRLKECDISYLSQSDGNKPVSISGIDFPSLTEPIEIGESGKILILGCPPNTSTHSPDQVIVFYSVGGNQQAQEKKPGDFLPTDDVLFSGDLWLMGGPMTQRGASSFVRRLRFGFWRIRSLISSKGQPRRNSREQDAAAKEALKRGFCLIRVKPGHGEEFIGSRLIPDSLQADRDLLLALGYTLKSNKSLLKAEASIPKIMAIKEQGYGNFVTELLLWTKLGYTGENLSELIARLYKEQRGGDRLAAQDRKERRERLEATLIRLKDDESKPLELRQVAEVTLPKIREVR